jgi:hypothetical protein
MYTFGWILFRQHAVLGSVQYLHSMVDDLCEWGEKVDVCFATIRTFPKNKRMMTVQTMHGLFLTYTQNSNYLHNIQLIIWT